MDCPKHSSHSGSEPTIRGASAEQTTGGASAEHLREIHQGASSSSELQGHSGEGVGGEEMEQGASSSDSANEGDFPILRIQAILHLNKDGSYKCEKVSKSDPRNDKYREPGTSPRESGSPSYKEKERMMNRSQLREMPWAERNETMPQQTWAELGWPEQPQQKKKVKQRVLPSSEEMRASKEAVLKFENMMHRRQHIQEDEKLRMRLTLVEEEEQDQNLVVRTPSRVSAAGERIQQIKEDVEEEEQDLDFAIKTPSSGVPEGDAQSASDSCAELEYQHLLDLATDAEREEVNEKRVKMKLKNKPWRNANMSLATSTHVEAKRA